MSDTSSDDSSNAAKHLNKKNQPSRLVFFIMRLLRPGEQNMLLPFDRRPRNDEIRDDNLQVKQS